MNNQKKTVQPKRAEPKKVIETVGKFFLKSKTVWINALVLIAALAGFVTGPDFPLNLSAEDLRLVVFIQSFVNLVLRFVTNEPLKVKK